MLIIATDLDRTLFPNGKQEYDGSMSIFNSFVESESPRLFYVTGRNAEEVKSGIAEFEAPWPHYAVCEVGTRIYKVAEGELVEDKGWIDYVAERTENWDIKAFRRALSNIQGAKPQEEHRQNRFKLSYYLDAPAHADPRSEEAEEAITGICPDASLVYSVDETNNVGLIDVLPREATKVAALEYLRKKSGASMDEVIYCGDSGNDLLPLTFGYRAVLVRNAIDEVRNEAQRLVTSKNHANRLYCAQGMKELNGYYVSGIIEGLIHFKVASAGYAG